MRRHSVSFWITFLVLIFLYVPIVVLVINSFNDSRFSSQWAGFTWKWYIKLWEESEAWHAFGNSLIVAISATCVSTILGSCAAFALHCYRTPLQKIQYGLIYIPLIIPDILMGISLLLFFVAVNIHLGLFTIFVAHTTFCLTYVTMVMRTKIQHFDFTLVEAAQDLGANRWIVGKSILLPLMMPGLASSALLAFILSIDEFIITFFVAGQGTSTLPIYVYTMIKFGSTPIINALSVIILVLTIVIVVIAQSFSKEDQP